jgi:hypothetical protein
MGPRFFGTLADTLGKSRPGGPIFWGMGGGRSENQPVDRQASRRSAGNLRRASDLASDGCCCAAADLHIGTTPFALRLRCARHWWTHDTTAAGLKPSGRRSRIGLNAEIALRPAPNPSTAWRSRFACFLSSNPTAMAWTDPGGGVLDMGLLAKGRFSWGPLGSSHRAGLRWHRQARRGVRTSGSTTPRRCRTAVLPAARSGRTVRGGGRPCRPFRPLWAWF